MRPFVEGVLGLKVMAGESELERESNLTGRFNVSETRDVIRHASLSYGVGLGVDFVLLRSKRPEGPAAKSGNLYLTVGGRFLTGGESEYIMAGSVRHSPAGPVVSTYRSRTPMVIPHIGLSGHYD